MLTITLDGGREAWRPLLGMLTSLLGDSKEQCMLLVGLAHTYCSRLMTTAVTLTAWFLRAVTGHHVLCSGYKNPKLKSAQPESDRTQQKIIGLQSKTQLHLCLICFCLKYIGYWSWKCEGGLTCHCTTAVEVRDVLVGRQQSSVS